MLETQSGRFSLQWVARRLFPERSSWQREILDILPGRITVSVCVYVLFSVAYRAWLEGCEPPPVTSACVSFLFLLLLFLFTEACSLPTPKWIENEWVWQAYIFSFLLRYLNWNLDCEVGQENFPRRTAGGIGGSWPSRWRGVNVV